VSAAVQAVVDAAHGGGPVNNAANPGANAAAPALVHAAAPSAPAIHAAANAAVQTGAPVPVSHLAVEIASQALSGKHRFEIRLDPPELGRIDVRLEVDREGRVTSKLVVERPETLDMLRRDASQLERALQQAGLKTSDNSLEFSLRQDAPNRDDDAPQDIARLTVSEDDPQPLEALRQGYGRHLGLGRGIDIRI
jgi:flagellar hook-length control protein FliK